MNRTVSNTSGLIIGRAKFTEKRQKIDNIPGDLTFPTLLDQSLPLYWRINSKTKDLTSSRTKELIEMYDFLMERAKEPCDGAEIFGKVNEKKR